MKMTLTIHAVENGYTVADSTDAAPKYYVAKNPTRLAEVIEQLAIKHQCTATLSSQAGFGPIGSTFAASRQTK